MQPDLMRILEESPRPLKLHELLAHLQAGDGPREKKRLLKALEQWRRQSLLVTVWQDGEVCYLAKNQDRKDDAFTPGSSFRLAVIRDQGSISFASQPLRHQGETHFYDRLLVTFCLIALGTLLSVAFYLFMG